MILKALILNVFLLSETFALLPRAGRPHSQSPLQQVKHMNQRIIARSKNKAQDKYGHDGPLRRSNYVLRMNVPNENLTELDETNSFVEERPNLKYIKSKNLTRELQKVNKIFSQDYKYDIGRGNDRSDSNSVSEDDSYDSSQNDRNGQLRQGELDNLLNVLRSKVNGNDRSDSNPVSEDDSYDSSQNDRNGKESVLFLKQGNDRSDSNSVSEADSNDRNDKVLRQGGSDKMLIVLTSKANGSDGSYSSPVSKDDSSQNDRNGKESRQGELDELLNVLRSKANENDRSDSNSVSEDDSYDSSQNDRNDKDRMLLLRQGNENKNTLKGNDRSDSNSVSEDDSYDSSQNDRNGKVLRQGELDKLLNVLRSKVNGNDRSDSNTVSEDSSQNERKEKQLLYFRQGIDRSDSNTVSEDDSYDSSQNDRRDKMASLRQGNMPLGLLMMRQAVGKKINAKLTPKQMTGQELSSEELEVDSNKYDNNGMIYLSRPDEDNEERELNVMMNRVATAGQDGAENIGRGPRNPKRLKDPLEREMHPKYDTNGMMYLSEPDGNNSERTLSVLLNKVVKYHEEGKKALRGTSLVEIFDPEEIRLLEDAVYTQTVEETQNGRDNNQNGRRFNLYRSGNVPDNSRRYEKKQFLGDLFNFNATLKNVTAAPNKTTGYKSFSGNLTSLKVTATTTFNFLKLLKFNSTSLAHSENGTLGGEDKSKYKFRSLGEMAQKNKAKKHYISPKIFDIYDMLL